MGWGPSNTSRKPVGRQSRDWKRQQTNHNNYCKSDDLCMIPVAVSRSSGWAGLGWLGWLCCLLTVLTVVSGCMVCTACLYGPAAGWQLPPCTAHFGTEQPRRRPLCYRLSQKSQPRSLQSQKRKEPSLLFYLLYMSLHTYLHTYQTIHMMI